MKQFKLIYIILVLFTIVIAFISDIASKSLSEIIIIFSGLKFLLVAFYFMEMKSAHILWKGIIFGFIIIFSILALILK
jgi:Flp pilus assembly protein protease CpaA